MKRLNFICSILQFKLVLVLKLWELRQGYGAAWYESGRQGWMSGNSRHSYRYIGSMVGRVMG